MNRVRWMGVPVFLFLAWLLARSSGVEVPWHAADAAEVRLSWSAPPERIEVCRALSESELDERPAHMRRAIECEGRAATYALTVQVDDSLREESVVHGAGLRKDRPLLLLRRFAAADGMHRLRVRFARREPLDSATASDSRASTPLGPGERRVRRERALVAIPPLLTLDTLVRFQSGRAILVTYRDGALVVDPGGH